MRSEGSFAFLLLAGFVLVGAWLAVSPLPFGATELGGFSALAFGVTAFEHPARGRITAHLQVLPGDHFRSIARALDLSIGETRHHLNVLVRQGRVREKRSAGRCRYYAVESGADRNGVFEKFWVYRDLRMRVLNAVCSAEAATPSEVSEALGISRQLADYHLLRLTEMGYLRRERGRYRA